jgi:hypothetical protein
MSFRERLDAWLTRRRLRLYASAVLLAMLAGFALAVAGGSGTARSLSGRLGGDFPAFYSAARIAASGTLGSLYDLSHQARVQAPLFPSGRPELLPFAYPPYVALAYAPLARLPYRAAYVLHTALMALALLAGVLALRRLAPRVAAYPLEAYAAALSFVPAFLALVGGQPAPLLFCALACACAASARGQDARAGLWLGVLCLKPQYALPFIALFALARRERTVVVAMLVFALCWGAAALASGPGWVAKYLATLAWFQAADQGHNAAHSIGFLGVSEAVLGPGQPLALALGGSLALACAAYLARLWVVRAVELGPRIAVSAPLVLLLEPHAMQYDATLLLPSLLVLADRGGRRALPTLAALYLCAALTPLADRLGVSPAFFVVLATLVLAWRRLLGARSAR